VTAPEAAHRIQSPVAHTPPVIAVTGVSHGYGDPGEPPSRIVLDDISMLVNAGELVAIVGPSGCGKTTLLNVMVGLEVPVIGAVTVFGHRPYLGDPDVSYVLARDALLPWRTALANVALGMEVRGVPRRTRETRASSALAAMGLGGFENHYPAQLSHGMRQRVALARALATQPKLVLLDEPFSALDAQTRLTLQDGFLRAWEATAQTAVLVTHDLNEAIVMADRVVIMTRGPGRLKAIHNVAIPRPRHVMELQSDSAFQSLYMTLWRELGEEVAAVSGSQDDLGVST